MVGSIYIDMKFKDIRLEEMDFIFNDPDDLYVYPTIEFIKSITSLRYNSYNIEDLDSLFWTI